MDLISIAIANKNKGNSATPQIQSDFAQNDSRQVDFIKNRPFYNINTAVYPTYFESVSTSRASDNVSLCIFPFFGLISEEKYSCQLELHFQNGTKSILELKLSAKLDEAGHMIILQNGATVGGEDGIYSKNQWLPAEGFTCCYIQGINLEKAVLTIHGGQLIKKVNSAMLPFSISNTITETNDIPTCLATKLYIDGLIEQLNQQIQELNNQINEQLNGILDQQEEYLGETE